MNPYFQLSLSQKVGSSHFWSRWSGYSFLDPDQFDPLFIHHFPHNIDELGRS